MGFGQFWEEWVAQSILRFLHWHHIPTSLIMELDLSLSVRSIVDLTA